MCASSQVCTRVRSRVHLWEAPAHTQGAHFVPRQLRVQGLPTLRVYASGPRSCPLDFRARARIRITCNRAPEGGAGRRENLNKTGILDGRGPKAAGWADHDLCGTEETTCELWLLPASHVTLGNPTSDPSLSRLKRSVCGLGRCRLSKRSFPSGLAQEGKPGAQLPGEARALAGPPASQNHTPPLQFPSKGGSRHHHFVFSQGGRLAACQSPARGSQVLTKHRPEQEGGAARGSGGVSWLPRPLPCTPTPGDELRAAGAALADNSKLLPPPLLGRRWGTLLP